MNSVLVFRILQNKYVKIGLVLLILIAMYKFGELLGGYAFFLLT